MSVLCDVGVYVRSMYMSGRRVCEINVYVRSICILRLYYVWLVVYEVNGMWCRGRHRLVSDIIGKS